MIQTPVKTFRKDSFLFDPTNERQKSDQRQLPKTFSQFQMPILRDQLELPDMRWVCHKR